MKYETTWKIVHKKRWLSNNFDIVSLKLLFLPVLALI